MKLKWLYLLLPAIIFFGSCSQFQKLLKSSDNDLKLSEAKRYYAEKKYSQSATLFDDISSYYKGTDHGEEVLYLLAKSYAGQNDFYSASETFKTYVKQYPRGQYAEESYYMIGYSAYLDSPDARLDQSSTEAAITAFTNFLESYPKSEFASKARQYLAEMKDKLAYKAYLNAKTYYNLGMYLGRNCYLSAVIVAENALKVNSETKYREDFMELILESKYAEARESVEARKADRYREVIDEYYTYNNEFPTGKYAKQALTMFKEAQNYIKNR